MIFKVKISDAISQDMTERELKKIVGDYILSRVKETGTMDGPHAAVPIYAIHLRGTSDFSAKPMWHLDANFINANQKVSSNGQINRWRNSRKL